MSFALMKVMHISNDIANNKHNFKPERLKVLSSHEATLHHMLSGGLTLLEQREIARLLATINACQTICLELLSNEDLDNDGDIGN